MTYKTNLSFLFCPSKVLFCLPNSPCSQQVVILKNLRQNSPLNSRFLFPSSLFTHLSKNLFSGKKLSQMLPNGFLSSVPTDIAFFLNYFYPLIHPPSSFSLPISPHTFPQRLFRDQFPKPIWGMVVRKAYPIPYATKIVFRFLC